MTVVQSNDIVIIVLFEIVIYYYLIIIINYEYTFYEGHSILLYAYRNFFCKSGFKTTKLLE